MPITPNTPIRDTFLPARLARVAVPLLVAGLTLSACSDDEPTLSSSSTTTTTPDSPSVTPSAPTPTAGSPSATPTTTPTPSPSAKPTSTPATPTAKPTTAACVAAQVGAPNTTGMSAAAAAKAKQIQAAAKACDAKALIALATADSTGLAGEQAPSAIFRASTPQNFIALAVLLTLEPTDTFDGTIQPKVFSERYRQDDSEWDKVIRAGLVTRAAAGTMRAADGGYTGYRVGIAGDGTWSFFTTGRR